MKFSELKNKTIVILGLGQEGLETLIFFRSIFPDKQIGIVDKVPFNSLSSEFKSIISSDIHVNYHFGDDYLFYLKNYDVIVKSPGISPFLSPVKETIQQLEKTGKLITSHTAIFFNNYQGIIIGITGTKGKSTTSSLIYAILLEGGFKTYLVGNIGNPPLRLISNVRSNTIFVYELSSHQLESLQRSPHIAVVLNIVPEHLDYYEDFNQYVKIKQNITNYQSSTDYLIYNAAFPIPTQIATEAKAKRIPYSIEKSYCPGCFINKDYIVFCSKPGNLEQIVDIKDVSLSGRFNLHNILPSVVVGKILKIPTKKIAKAISSFKPLKYRLELIGAFHGINFYDDALATVPEATIAALDTLSLNVETIILGGQDRHLDFSELAQRLLNSNIKNIICFPATGKKIWESVCMQCPNTITPPKYFLVSSMKEAVSLAYQHTQTGKICLHSPASPSFGIFKNYEERSNLFRTFVKRLGTSWTE